MLTLYALPIASLDLVMGLQWLEMFGSVVCNWKQLTMEFVWENTPQKWQGMNTETIREASVKEMSKEFRQGHSLFEGTTTKPVFIKETKCAFGQHELE